MWGMGALPFCWEKFAWAGSGMVTPYVGWGGGGLVAEDDMYI